MRDKDERAAHFDRLEGNLSGPPLLGLGSATGAAPFLGSLPSLVVGRRCRRRRRRGGHRSLPPSAAAATLTAFLWLVLARFDLAIARL